MPEPNGERETLENAVEEAKFHRNTLRVELNQAKARLQEAEDDYQNALAELEKHLADR
jgi:hypothetical protein